MTPEGDNSVNTTSEYLKDDSFYVYEIVFSLSSSYHPALHPSLYCHHLASEHYKPQPPPCSEMKYLKFFLDLFVDNFGPYRNVYHMLGDVYLAIGNLLLQLQQLIRNNFLLGFVPFGASFDDFIIL